MKHLLSVNRQIICHSKIPFQQTCNSYESQAAATVGLLNCAPTLRRRRRFGILVTATVMPPLETTKVD